MDTISCRMDCYSGVKSYEINPGVEIVEYPFYEEDYTLTVGENHLIRVIIDSYYEVEDGYVYLAFTTPDKKTELNQVAFTQVSSKVWELETDFIFDYSGDYSAVVYCRGIKKYAHVEANLNNAVLDCEPGDYLPGEKTFIVTCEPSFEFQALPYVSDDYFHHYDFEKVDDCTYQITVALEIGVSYTINADAVQKTVVLDRYGTISIYRPSKDDLKFISSKRWIKKKYQMENGVVNESEEYIDTGKYVVSLLKVFAKLEALSKERVYFGPYDMEIECDIIGNDRISLNCGNVRICGVHENSIDYENTDMEAYLPFIGFVTLSTADFMDKEISLEYQINVINGDGLAVFKANNEVIASYSCNVAFHVPYQLGGGEYQNTNLQPNTNYLLNEPPFIYVKTHNAVNQDKNLPYHDTNFYSCFGDLTGYTEATEIDLHIISHQITAQEIEEIKQLLETGVFF